MRANRDLIELVEASYREAGSLDAWGCGVVDAAMRTIDQGQGITAQVTRIAGRKLELLWSRTTTPGYAQALPDFFALWANDADVFRRALDNHRRHCTFFGADPTILDDHPHLLASGDLGAFPDVLGVFLADGEPDQLQLYAPMAEREVFDEARIKRYQRVGVHVSAGYRATKRRVGAILATDGRVLHAEGGADEPTTLRRLRDRVVALDAARGRAAKTTSREATTDELLEIWRGLVDGAWSLVDRFDTDGKRFVVVKKNDPDVAVPLPLSPREKQIVFLAAQGYPSSNIAYALGLAPATVSEHLARALPKLGLAAVGDLVELFAAMTRGARADEIPIEGARKRVKIGG